MLLLGLGVLGWYYAHAFTARRITRARRAQAQVNERARGEMPLPPLGSDSAAALSRPPRAPQARNPRSPLPVANCRSPRRPSMAAPAPTPAASHGRAHERSGLHPTGASVAWCSRAPADSGAGPASPGAAGVRAGRHGVIDLHGERTAGGCARDAPADRAPAPRCPRRCCPTQRLLLPKGAFIDCTLETAIDSTLAGHDDLHHGHRHLRRRRQVVLLERGTKLVGETRGQVQQGAARVFVLWTRGAHPDRRRRAAGLARDR